MTFRVKIVEVLRNPSQFSMKRNEKFFITRNVLPFDKKNVPRTSDIESALEDPFKSSKKIQT